MPWDWDKLQKQKMGKGGNPGEMNDILSKFRGMKGKFPGFWIIIAIVIILVFLSS